MLGCVPHKSKAEYYNCRRILSNYRAATMTETLPENTESPKPKPKRFHDLDALRAFAMLLGIVLHGGMSFWLNYIWPAQDINMNNGLFKFLNDIIHGFRMPLFFMISGFFTMMMWEKRGSLRLIRHRFVRIVIPLVACYLALIPFMEWTAEKGGAKKRRILAKILAQENETSQSDEFLMAAARGDLDAISSFLDDGMNINAKGDSGGTALHAAAFFGQPEIVEFLIEKGIDVSILDNSGNTALGSAKSDWEAVKGIGQFIRIELEKESWQQGQGEVIALLEKVSADTKVSNPELIQPFHLAVVTGNLEEVKRLIDEGVYIDAPTQDGGTALTVAAFFGKDEIFEMLVENGANLDVVDGQGQSLEKILESNWDTVNFVSSMFKIPVDADDWKTGRNSINLYLSESNNSDNLENPEDDNSVEPEDELLDIHWAVIDNEVETIKTLIESGADPNAKTGTKDGNTPLHMSVVFGRAEVFRTLLENGADIKTKNKLNESVVDMMKTKFDIASLFVDLEEEEWKNGRAEIANIFKENRISMPKEKKPAPEWWKSFMGQYRKLAFNFKFQHLWFLIYLIFLVIGFLLVVPFWHKIAFFKIPDWVTSFPLCLIWLFPLTLFWQLKMTQGFGPDTVIGWVPWWTTFGYYATFFGFGALCFGRESFEVKLGKHWPVFIAVAGVCLFLGLQYMSGDHLIKSTLIVGYSWMTIFALMGIFRQFFSSENRVLRYISDASYWLYLMHQPLLYVLQIWVSEWPLPAEIKFVFVCVLTFGILMLSYEFLIRYTIIGTVLNGKKKRSKPSQNQPIPSAT